jgi:hypothetical protein
VTEATKAGILTALLLGSIATFSIVVSGVGSELLALHP